MKNPSRRSTGDLSSLYSKIEDIRKTTRRSFEPSPEEVKRILKTRAMELSLEPDKQESETEVIEVLEFLLSSERYGIQVSSVIEIVRLREFTLLPGTPPFVLGVVNVRGKIVSLIDIRKFFHLPEKGLTERDKMIILREGEMELGILAEEIAGIRPVGRSRLQVKLFPLTGIGAEYLLGVTGDGLIVLDSGRMLSDRRIIVHEEV